MEEQMLYLEDPTTIKEKMTTRMSLFFPITYLYEQDKYKN